MWGQLHRGALSCYAGKFEQFQSPYWRYICIPADYTNPGCHRVESIVRLYGESRPRSRSRGTMASLPGIEHSIHRDANISRPNFVTSIVNCRAGIHCEVELCMRKVSGKGKII